MIGSLAAHYRRFSRMQADYESADLIGCAEERVQPERTIPVSWRRRASPEVPRPVLFTRHWRLRLVAHRNAPLRAVHCGAALPLLY
jgi:hypothetical protein